ncbi:tetratricopeptide repeat protein [Dysgonomonas sp.]|jgi:tetratricopeptide (TPR) repeat protein|uniref:tetratricopeptide repeat protein n=1 Tax=Dysgonomonas sp. TaxID=1891233 RepID=UPI0028308276|nr:tetratricopeptide repeat protein [Dysgonomonas sp.]MDR2001692.1 tetratricopeptide repeat protein [Prevotella sp.]HMM04272.1 tetratricopeptide repeat protein [Dysgonomonas sp.]
MGACPDVNFDKIYTLNTDDLEACSDIYCKIANDISRRYHFKEAILYYDKAIEMNPNNSEAWLYKGWALCERGLYEEAKTYFNEAIKLNPEHSESYYYKEALKRKENIIKLLQEIKLDSTDTKSLLEKGIQFLNYRDFYKTRIYFEEVLKLSPDYLTDCVKPLWKKGIEQTGSINERMIYLEEIIRLAPDIPDICNVLIKEAELLESDGLYNEAITCYNKALELNPEYYEQWKDACFNVWRDKGIGLFYKRFYNEAILCFEEALKLKPNDTRMLENKEYLLEIINKRDN